MNITVTASAPRPPSWPRRAGRLARLVGVALILVSCAAGHSPVETALAQAEQAVQNKDGNTATAALDRAQNAWQTANTSVENPQFPQEGTALQQIGEAREAVRQQHWDQATYYIKAAMDHASDLTPQ